MPSICHVAIWARDVDQLCQFYATYFGATVGQRYANPRTGFSSRFVSFDSGARIEIIHKADLRPRADAECDTVGYAHLAISAGSEEAVDTLTAHLDADGYTVVDGPRHTGDGYYEAVVLDPEGNKLEITV
jgi:lactoylglutathione lyase